jgi:DNA-binding NtrC family response regulator
MNPKILLIAAGDDYRWIKIVTSAANKLTSSLDVIGSAELDSIVSWHDYWLVILDASYKTSLSKIIPAIHSIRNDLPVIVLSPAPKWQEAKEALSAGARDYGIKSSNSEDIFRIIKNNITVTNSQDD